MVILKGIPSILTPELLYVLARMGHGDELVLADANFPTASICKCGPAEIRADETLVTVEFLKYQKYLLYQIPRKIIFDGCNGGTCVGIPELLKAIMKLFPLDTYDDPAAVMDLVQSDKLKGLKVPIWDQYSSLLKQAGSDGSFKFVERFAFYERAKNAFAVVATGETALYGNLIIKKGVISPDEQC